MYTHARARVQIHSNSLPKNKAVMKKQKKCTNYKRKSANDFPICFIKNFKSNNSTNRKIPSNNFNVLGKDNYKKIILRIEHNYINDTI